MTAGAPSQVLRVPGRLVIDPTDLGIAHPYGGVEVGLVRRMVIQSLGSGFRVESEARGEPTDVLEASIRYVMACFVRGWDDDAVRLLFPHQYDAGSVSGHAKFTVPNRVRPGSSVLDHARRFLYVPDDPVRAPALLVSRGLPDWPPGAEVAMQRSEELGLPLVVECVRNSNGRILQIARLVDLVLDA